MRNSRSILTMTSIASVLALGAAMMPGGFNSGGWASRYRAAPKSNRSKWTTPHQGKRECARRMRQMAKGTHGYQRTNEFTPSPSLRVDGSIDPYSA